MPPEVRGLLGDTVQLPCHLLSQGPKVNVSQVTWQRLDPSGKTQSVAAFHPSHGLSFPSPQLSSERLSFLTMGAGPGAQPGSEMQDATLVLQGLRVEDEGNYSCEFATFPQGTSRGVTWLRAIGEQGEGGGEVGEPPAGPFLSLRSLQSAVNCQMPPKHVLCAGRRSASSGGPQATRHSTDTL